MSAAPRYDETISLPRAVKFPLELLPPEQFDSERLETWPRVAGRLEYAEGKLLYMPPSGDLQQDTVADVVIALGSWVRARPQFVLGTNEAGMHLAGATRAADAALWRRADVGAYAGGLRRVPPVLAVEVAGPGDGETEGFLTERAEWYLQVGVSVVWLVLPESREVVVITAGGRSRHAGREPLPAHPQLPGLSVEAAELFRQIECQCAAPGS